MKRRKMGEGSMARVLFGRQPDNSPVKNGGLCGLLTLAAIAATAVFLASAVNLAHTLTGGA